jgi:serpin B
VLVNAIHLKAPWAREFPARATQPLPFHLKNGDPVKVDTMQRTGKMGYAKLDGFQAITVPYLGGELHLLVLLPETRDGLAALEAKLTPELLAACAPSTLTEIELSLPKFKLEPPVFKLAETLRSLGMTHAFDDPKGSANFDRMAPRTPKDYLMISEVFHKTYMTLDEKGTEAAAATAVTMTRSTSLIEPTTPVAVRVDHPFLFAIQHRSSGTCLFLGRLCDPRE